MSNFYSFIFILLLYIPVNAVQAQQTIRLHFLYGSKPAKEYKEVESKHFGGLKGGHVNIEVNGRVLDFLPGKCPLFPNNKKPSGGYYINHGISWDTANTKWTMITIPVNPAQMQQLEQIMDSFAKRTPYDYAVFGMRCAAASYDVLSRIGLVKKMKNAKKVTKFFYPKLLRKKMMKWAVRKGYPVIQHEGRRSRKWEADKGVL
ncbi:MAG: hypothetical protein NTW29_08905 [Bacteroidetes bacterium]|nr:hypothetical protein [Bacteroidota bacterium]